MKLTKELISTIIAKKPIQLTKDQCIAVFKLLGLQIKEFQDNRDNSNGSSISFEIHHKRQYIINVDAGLARAISFNNEWVNFGEGCHGVSMPVENVGELLAITVNFFIEKLHIKYDGPEYSEDRFYEYENVDELQQLLEHLQELLSRD